MNLELKKKLDIACEYYEYDFKEYVSKITENRIAIANFKAAFRNRHRPQSPKEQMTEQSVKDILLCFFLWPIGLINMRKNKANKDERELQANQRFVEEMKSYEEFCEEVTRSIKHAFSNIESIEKARKEYKKANAESYSFLPAPYQNRWSVSALRDYVSAGRADTLKEAINLMHADIERERDRELQKERFEKDLAERQRFHKETLASLEEIKRKQDEAATQRQQMQRIMSEAYYSRR